MLQERFYRRLRARGAALELSAFGLCDCPRGDGLSVASFGGLGRLSCEDGRLLLVHSVPHNSLSDSIGPGTAKCISLEVLSVDGGLDFAGQGISGLFVYVATCALFEGRHKEPHIYAPIPLILLVPTKKNGRRSGKRLYLMLEV